MLFSALAIPAIYACAPSSVKEIAKPRWLHDIGVAVSASLAAKSEPEVSSVDPIAAAKVDEDLDYRIAERTKSTEGWRAFLAAHPDGPHAQAARAELDKLAPPASSAPAAATLAPPAQAPGVQAADAKVPSESVSPSPQSTESDGARVASDETCRGDEDRLQRLSGSPTSDGILRLLIDLHCEKLRPELLSLAKRLDDKPPAPSADAAQDASPSALPTSVASAPPLPPPRMRANEPLKRPHPHGVEPKGHAAQRAGPNLPQFLLAFFGGGARNSTAARRVQAISGAGH
jgi:hypothetical protein